MNGLEFLTQTDPLKGDDYWRVTIRRAEHGVELVYRRLANRGFEVQWSELLAGPWQFLDVRENRPVFSATSDEVTVADPASGSQRFYRVQVFEP